MAGIFISYRRDDSAPYAGRLYDRLTREFSGDAVFMDIDRIEPGDDFVDVINARLDSCDAVIALIGRSWLTCTDRSGARRLDNPDDYIRKELATALARKARVVPVLVGDAEVPRSVDLPDDLKALSRRHAIELSDTRFHADVDRLIEALRKSGAPLGVSAAGAAPREDELAKDAKDPRQMPETMVEPPPAASPQPVPVQLETAAQQPAAAQARRAPGKTPSARKALVALAIAILVLATGAIFVITRGTIEVPDLTGKSLQDARATIEAAGFTVGGESHIEHETAAEGTVVEQNPVAGAQARSRTSVEIKIAAKPRIEVPNVVGEILERAKGLIDRSGLVLAPAQLQESADQPQGTVLKQSPGAGTRVVKGETVQVVVAARPALLLPDVRGQLVAQARKTLAAAGMRIGGIEYRKSSERAEGTVLDQRPGPDAKLDRGSTVNLVVAARPLVEVPDVVGTPLGKARALLDKRGLALGEITKAGLHDKDTGEPLVRSQSPSGSTRVEAGSMVNLIVADAGVRVPDVKTMPLERARLLLESAGLALGHVRDVKSRAPTGSVVEQAKAAGTLVAKGDAVNLTVAAEPPVKSITMPDLFGTPRRVAVETLRTMGLSRITATQKVPPPNVKTVPGEVWSQTPPAGSPIKPDTPVIITYGGIFEWLTVPGQVKSGDEARAHANAQCPTVCRKNGWKWGGQYGFRDTVRCGCEVY